MKENTEPNATAYLWNAPSLLVPVDVQALVFSNLSKNLPWSYNKMNYNNAGQFIDVAPSLFNTHDQPGVGVTLHWALPDGITHGVQQKDGTIVYPYAPNRWLVTRYYDGTSKSWLLQSDYLNQADGANFYLDPNQPVPTFTRLGKVWNAGDWPGEGGVTQQKFLVALGPGNTAFAAYTANINGVFSFYDSADEIKDKATPLTYMVMGWYSDANDDPLLGKAVLGNNGFTTLPEWKTVMDALQWTVGDDDELQKAVNDWTAWAQANGITIDPNNVRDLYPSRTICQGMIYNVNWLGQNGALQSGVPQYNSGMPADVQPVIAIGNTSIDALSALVEYELNLEGKAGTAAAELLEAFNYNLLNTYEMQGGQYELYRQIFTAWFGNNDPEDFWYVESKESAEPIVLPPDLLEKLVQLNQQAAQLSSKQYQEILARMNLYGNWWKNGKAGTFWGTPPQGVTKQQWATVQANLKTAVPLNKDEVKKLQDDIATLQTTVSNLLDEIKGQISAKQELKKNVGTRYHDANDPVVLIYGAHRNYRHGEDGRFDSEDKLFTRFTGQTVTGMLVRIPNQTPPLVNAGNVTIPPLGLKPGLFPKESDALGIDTFFFNTLSAELIARAACAILKIAFDPSYIDIVKKQQTAAWNADINELDRQMVTDTSGLQGTIPSRIAIELWAAPWSPLYMAWEVTWFPSYTTPADALKNWNFDPTILEYAWDARVTPGGSGLTYGGSCIITPKSAFTMQAQLEKYLDETGKFPDLKAFLDTVANWDFLSQSMSGFNTKLLALNADQLNPPPADIASLVKDATQLNPYPEQTTGFFPIRAGHFQLKRLWIVDDFGQVFDPIGAVGQTPASYKPVLGTGLITPNNANLVQLPPRITQDARLEVDLVNAYDQSLSLQVNQEANPICGWLLPNHLDKGLSVYSPDGELMGELLLTGSAANQTLRWDNVPGVNIPVGTPLTQIFSNYPYLGDFVENLLARNNNAQSFSDFLNIIDETLWAVEPLGGRKNELISVYIGRPLALTRMRVNYAPMGGLQYSQNWLDSTLKVTGGYEKVKFPLQIGCVQSPQDGTIGYFFEDFSTFNTILTSSKPLDSGYITRISPSISLDDQPLDIFVLVDPRGDVNVISGILPIEVRVLPGTLTENALANMHVTFRTGPLITNPKNLVMPLPSELSGNWSWIQHTGVTTWEEVSQIGQANGNARFDTTHDLKDGWLKLSNINKKTTHQ
jgi:hypothetical protein